MRYGVREPDDPTIVDSVKVVDAALKVDIKGHPCWKRYNGDGYGQHPDGRAFDGTGRGGPWPLLAGERGHYELALALKRGAPTPTVYLRAMEAFATATGILPEQLWDLPDNPGCAHLLRKPDRPAVPLAWAHGEYIKLVRSVGGRKVFDRIDEVATRYTPRGPHTKQSRHEFWNFQRPVDQVAKAKTLRIVLREPFSLHWSGDGWRTVHDTAAIPVPALGLRYVDVPLGALPGPLRFTFFWPGTGRWEGRDFRIELRN